MNKKFFLIIGILVVIALGALYIIGGRDGEKSVAEDRSESRQNAPNTRGDSQDAPFVPEGTLAMILEDSETQNARLDAVDGSTSTGIGHVLVKDGMLYHVATASMPDPEEGSVYEGWLVQPSPLAFFSTGVMKKQNGAWLLEYTAQGSFDSYTKVVITEETIVDETPEKHIVEGSFLAE